MKNWYVEVDLELEKPFPMEKVDDLMEAIHPAFGVAGLGPDKKLSLMLTFEAEMVGQAYFATSELLESSIWDLSGNGELVMLRISNRGQSPHITAELTGQGNG